MRVYYDRDADVNLIKGKKVLVVGYGSQGHAHAMNLRDSGVKDVRIALKPGSATIKKAEGVGFTVMSPADGAKWADIIMVLAPDELQSDIYNADLGPNMKPGAALAFAHGLNVHFNLITPRSDIDVFMIAPNTGEDLKPLAAIASGGELSRVVLALKAILARSDLLETVVFDEVDAGIGGGVATFALNLAKAAGCRVVVTPPLPETPITNRQQIQTGLQRVHIFPRN